MKKRYEISIISHTHWDREWYEPYQNFRAMLVDMVDNLLEILETNSDYKHFHLDGQFIPVEDYLQIRPDKYAIIKKYVKNGRLLIGPFYTLTDEFLVSGESIIRNLLKGIQLSKQLGNVMKVGYLVDIFGHISQMPQILTGFGIDNAIVLRGLNQENTKSEFLWVSPDNSKVLAIKLSDNVSYSNFFYFLRPVLTSDKKINIEETINLLKDFVNERISEATTSYILGMDGCDHLFANLRTIDIINIGNKYLKDYHFVHTTLPEYIHKLKKSVKYLKEICGELRITDHKGNLNQLLSGTISSRMYLKQTNYNCEKSLEKYAEPLSVLTWLFNKQYPSQYLNIAWKHLLENSAHDSICGCSVDRVHRDMMYRYNQCQLISELVKNKAITTIKKNIDTDSIYGIKKHDIPIIIFNTTEYYRREVIEPIINLPIDKVPQNINLYTISKNRRLKKIESLLCSVNKTLLDVYKYNPVDVPINKEVIQLKAKFIADNIPPLGYKVFILRPIYTKNKSVTIKDDTLTAENKYYKLWFNNNGTINIIDKMSSKKFTSLHYFEDCADIGDGYGFKRPENDIIITTKTRKAKITILEKNNLTTIFNIDYILLLPINYDFDKKCRSVKKIPYQISSLIELQNDCPYIKITTRLNNIINDHRLRVCFPIRIRTNFCYAESSFDVIKRNINLPYTTGWIEPASPTQPQKKFIDVSDNSIGIAILNQGIPEYEVTDDRHRIIKLTLLRCFGQGIRGKENHIDSQCHGEYVFKYAIIIHRDSWEKAEIYKYATEFNYPLLTAQTDIHKGSLPLNYSFANIEPEGLLISALKKCETRDTICMRIYNIRSEQLKSKIVFFHKIKQVYLINLNEERIKRIKFTRKNTIEIIIPSKKIVTFEIVV